MWARAYGLDHVCRRGLATRLLVAVCTAHALVQQSHGAECTVDGCTYYTKSGVDSFSFISQQECEDVYFSKDCQTNLGVNNNLGLTPKQWASGVGRQVEDRADKPKGCRMDWFDDFQSLWYNTGRQIDKGKRFGAITSILKKGNVPAVFFFQAMTTIHRNLRVMRRRTPLPIPLRLAVYHVCCA